MAAGLSSVVTYAVPAAPGRPLTDPRWLGTVGPVANLTYSYIMPGGPDQLSCTLQVTPDLRQRALDPARICRVVRGGAVVWDGKLLEAVPSPAGWAITAVGLGHAGADFMALWFDLAEWENQNYSINQAISRGLRWSNPGIPSGVWLGQEADSGSQTIEDLLNLYCTLGGYTWYVTCDPSGGNGVLNVTPFPQGASGLTSALAPDRLLTCTVPVARTLGGDINTVYVRYQSSADAATAAVYQTATATVPASIAQHGPVEAYVDVSSAGTQTSAAATALGASVLARYVRASFAGPFTVRPGELMTTGGQPADLGAEQAGSVCQLVVTDYGYGGEVVPGPVTFLVGATSWDDQNQVLQVTPYQSLDMSVSSMLSAAAARMAGATVSGRLGGGTAAQERTSTRLAKRPNPGGPVKRRRK